MSSIKNEYELMLAFQRERIRELEPLKVNHCHLSIKNNFIYSSFPIANASNALRTV